MTTQFDTTNGPSSGFNIIAPEGKGMEKFLAYLIARTPQDKIPQVETALKIWANIHSNKIFENPTPDYHTLFRTYRGMAAITARGEVKTTEVVRFENYDLFTRDEEEREYTLAEIKWDNKGIMLTNASRKHAPSSSIYNGTAFDSDGDAQTSRLSHAIRTMTFILNRELRYDMDGISFFNLPEGVSPTSDNLKRLTPETEQAFKEAYLEDLEVYRQLRSNFIGRLDPEALSIMELAGDNSVKGYNWMCGFDVVEDIRNDMRASRQLATSKYPLCIEFLKNLNYTGIQDALTSGQDIEPSLAEALQTSEANLRCFEGICPEDIGLKGQASTYDARTFIKSASLPANLEDMPLEERRAFVRSTFLVAKLESAILNGRVSDGKVTSLKFVTSSTPLPPEDDIKKAIENCRYVSAWLYTIANMTSDALAGQGNNSYQRMPQLLTVVTSGQDVSTAVSVINDIADHIAEDRGLILRRFPSRQPGIAMEWASMFRENTKRLTNGTICRVLTSKDDMDLAFQQIKRFIASAYGVAFETTKQYVMFTNNDGKPLGIATVSPDKILKGIIPVNLDDDIWGVDSIAYVRDASDADKQEMRDNVIEFKRFILNSPDSVHIGYVESEQQSRQALAREHYRQSPAIIKAKIYSPGLDVSDDAFQGIMRAFRRILPEPLQNITDRDDFARAALAHVELQEDAIREEAEFRNRSQIHGPHSNENEMTPF